eukprot:1762567-Pyramimonas_sp.AAC.1
MQFDDFPCPQCRTTERALGRAEAALTGSPPDAADDADEVDTVITDMAPPSSPQLRRVPRPPQETQ